MLFCCSFKILGTAGFENDGRNTTVTVTVSLSEAPAGNTITCFTSFWGRSRGDEVTRNFWIISTTISGKTATVVLGTSSYQSGMPAAGGTLAIIG